MLKSSWASGLGPVIGLSRLSRRTASRCSRPGLEAGAEIDDEREVPAEVAADALAVEPDFGDVHRTLEPEQHLATAALGLEAQASPVPAEPLPLRAGRAGRTGDQSLDAGAVRKGDVLPARVVEGRGSGRRPDRRAGTSSRRRGESPAAHRQAASAASSRGGRSRRRRRPPSCPARMRDASWDQWPEVVTGWRSIPAARIIGATRTSLPKGGHVLRRVWALVPSLLLCAIACGKGGTASPGPNDEPGAGGGRSIGSPGGRGLRLRHTGWSGGWGQWNPA